MQPDNDNERLAKENATLRGRMSAVLARLAAVEIALKGRREGKRQLRKTWCAAKALAAPRPAKRDKSGALTQDWRRDRARRKAARKALAT